MFSDSPFESVGFSGNPDTKRDVRENSSQTSTLNINSCETQTVLSHSSSSQTKFMHTLRNPPPYDVQKLASFLSNIYPKLMTELNKNENNHISYKYDNANEDEPVTNLHQIVSKENEGKAVSSVTWNSTGMSLALSFCNTDHESWCTHEGHIHIYSTSKKDFTASPPTYHLVTNSCVKCIRFHPSEPLILVAGLYNGQVLVWNLEKEETFIPKEKGEGDNLYEHSDSVTNISWIEESSTSMFVSVGKDGKIIIWKINLATKTLKIIERYYISSSHYNVKNTLATDYAEIRSVSLWKNVKDDFIVAGGGSNLLHCSRKTSQTIPIMPGFSDPVFMKYEPHTGIVTAVSCYAETMFASCGTDSEIRVYRSREKSPVHVIYSDMVPYGIDWVEGHIGLISCWGSSPSLHFYKTYAEEKLDSYSITLCDSETKITAAKLNRNRRGIVAVGTVNGETSIWLVPQIRL